MTEQTKTPKVQVLGPITPTDEGDHLTYAKLQAAVDRQSNPGYENSRQSRAWDAEPKSLEEIANVRQLALQYLLQTALKQTTAISDKSKKLWADRYTEASQELYGKPDSVIVGSILRQEIKYFSDLLGNPRVDQEILNDILCFYQDIYKSGDLHTEEQVNNSEAEIKLKLKTANSVNEYLLSQYKESLDVFNEKDNSLNSAIQIAEKFQHALQLLAGSYPDFNYWKVMVIEGKDSLSVAGGNQEIIVGANRRPAPDKELKGLFAHEALVHALRWVNGSKKDERLSTGLPDYLDAEEGLGTYFEYCITGLVPEKNKDRYLDIAIALGLSGEMMQRSKLMSLVKNREIIRAQARSQTVDYDFINAKVSAHINRIYRGTSGDNIPGVFTKDIAYHEGFIKIERFIQQKIEENYTVAEIINFLLQGKFDPTNELHINYLRGVNEAYII
jgi:hypothetical protein